MTLSEDEANALLAILSELPIKYLGIVQRVQQFFQQKFAEDAPSSVFTATTPKDRRHGLNDSESL